MLLYLPTVALFPKTSSFSRTTTHLPTIPSSSSATASFSLPLSSCSLPLFSSFTLSALHTKSLEFNSITSVLTRPRYSPSSSRSLSSSRFEIGTSSVWTIILSMFWLGTEAIGREPGLVSFHGGKLRARWWSYVNVSLELNGLEIIHEVVYLIEDLARGVIPLNTNTKVSLNSFSSLFFSFISVICFFILMWICFI